MSTPPNPHSDQHHESAIDAAPEPEPSNLKGCLILLLGVLIVAGASVATIVLFGKHGN